MQCTRTKTVGLNVNQGVYSQDFTFPNVTYNDYYWDINIRIQRTSEASGKLYIRMEAVDNSAFMTSPETKIIVADLPVNFLMDMQFGIIGYNGSASSDVTCESFIGMGNLLDVNS